MAKTFEELEALSHRLTALAETVCESSFATGSRFGILGARVLARCTQSLYAVRLLVSKGCNGDAMSVARTIVEFAIDLAYIADNPEERVAQYESFGATRAHHLAEGIDNMHDGAVPDSVMESLRVDADAFKAVVKKWRDGWSGHSLKKRASEITGDPDRRKTFDHLYSVVYNDMCLASHSGVMSLKYAETQTPNGPVLAFAPQAPDVKAIEVVMFPFLVLIDVVASATSTEVSARLTSLANELADRDSRSQSEQARPQS